MVAFPIWPSAQRSTGWGSPIWTKLSTNRSCVRGNWSACRTTRCRPSRGSSSTIPATASPGRSTRAHRPDLQGPLEYGQKLPTEPFRGALGASPNNPKPIAEERLWSNAVGR
jgi:hypothetical protein